MEHEFFDSAVRSLARLTSRLRLLGTLLFAGTALLIGVAVALPLFPGLLRLNLYTAALSLMAMNIVAGLLFERTRKEGDVLFHELSDEVQWQAASAPDPQARRFSIPLQLRLRFRSFVQASDLPVVPGRLGLLVYLVTNIATVVILYFMLRYSTHYP